MKRIFRNFLLAICILAVFTGFQKKESYIKTLDGIIVPLDSLNIRLHILGENIIRIECNLLREVSKHPSLVVVNSSPVQISWFLKEEPGAVILSTSSLQAKIELSSGKIQFIDISDKVLLQENGREIVPVTVMGEKTFGIRQKFVLSPAEAVYGLGQHQQGNMNLRGKTVDLYQVNMKVSVPMLVSSRGYGILWDNYSLSKFNDGAQGMQIWSEVADGIDYYFIAGNTIDDVISGYRTLTGQAPLYPKWAYGFFQSKERYQTQAEVLSVVDEFRQRRIPLDVIVQDWYYWEPQKWGSHYLSRTRYPDPVKMVNEVHNKNAKIIISVWAKFDSTSPNYTEMDRQGFLWKHPSWETSRYYDAYNPAARELYWRQIKDSLFSRGIDGWWLDATEPETGDLRNDETKKLMNNILGTGARYLNTFPLMTTTAVYNGQRQVTADRRVYILTRSAFPGQQRNAATTWSGDITARWDVFRRQIPAGLNFCFTGIPYWTTDIGGFIVNVPGGSQNDMYKELFTRWYQYGTFCPIFRVHGTSTPREMWRFGDTGSWAYDTQLKFNNLRYRLLPYIYSLAWKVTHEGYTLMRGLAFDFARDTSVSNIDDQFMFGPAILVNPVTEALYYPWIEADSGKIIAAENLLDLDGTHGLTGEYYQGMNFNKLFTRRSDRKIDFNWNNDAPFKDLAPDTFSVRWSGQLIAPQSGEYTFNTLSDDGTRLFIDNRLIIDAWQDQAPLLTSGKIFLEAGKKYAVRLDYYENRIGAVVQLRWILPSEKIKTAIKLPAKTRKVYLPASAQWIDFWTGKTFAGGQTITAPAPIEIMPLYVKAGSIIPLGPFLQYSTEKPANPLELRIYPGADGTFELYEDENDNYNYEQGKYAIIPFSWNDKESTLVIGERQGEFAGMLRERTIHIVLVNQSTGNGVEPAMNYQTIHYSGSNMKVKVD